MIELIGIIGGALFAAGCIPMAYSTWRKGSDVGTPLITQWLLFLACLFYSAYLFGAFGWHHLPFWFLAIEVVCWGIAVWYHYFPRNDFIVTKCTREDRHDGACNGWPRETCPGYIDWKNFGKDSPRPAHGYWDEDRLDPAEH